MCQFLLWLHLSGVEVGGDTDFEGIISLVLVQMDYSPSSLPSHAGRDTHTEHYR
jgi:hypothetical protein